MAVQITPSQAPNPTDQELKAGLWYLHHKRGLDRLFILILGIIILITWGWFLFVYADYYLFSARREAAIARALATAPVVPTQTLDTAYTPKDLVIGDLQQFSSPAATDLMLVIQNPNPNWAATVDYQFSMGEAQTQLASAVVLPGDIAYLVSTLRKTGLTPTYSLSNVRWKRISSQDIPDFSVYRTDHLNFPVKDTTITPTVIPGKGTITRISFTISNATPWSYWNPNFIVLWLGGSDIRGVGQITFDQFRSGQTRTGDLTIFGNIGAIGQVQVIPQINILDPSVYMSLPEATPTTPGT